MNTGDSRTIATATDADSTTGFYSDLLTVAHVPHTRTYSEQRFSHMPFMTMFGLKKLLEEYGVDSVSVTVQDAGNKTTLALQLTVPYVAPVRCGQWVIVTAVNNTDNTVTYISQGVSETAPAATFANAWNGTALLVTPKHGAVEPDYASHRLAAFMTGFRDIGIKAALIILPILLMAQNGLFHRLSTILLVVMNCVGLTVSYMLAQKTVGVHTRVADKVCSAIQEHGCDHVLNTGGTFLGIFHWSEVGFGYFTVSLLALLLGGSTMLPWLALFNLCCLPYSLWSVWYQHFRAHAWCTLCLIVQGTLWILAGLYLWSGAWSLLTGFSLWAVILLAFYVATVLGLNKVLNVFNPSNS